MYSASRGTTATGLHHSTHPYDTGGHSRLTLTSTVSFTAKWPSNPYQLPLAALVLALIFAPH
jgi:hypothetical protein